MLRNNYKYIIANLYFQPTPVPHYSWYSSFPLGQLAL